jgi:antitoxin component of RelBE/YafQ-DinJ toxin-antitoxin module
MEKKKFDQNAYINDWAKKNMGSISARYKKEFVEEFKEACRKLNLKQSDVIRNMMQNIINQAKEKD